jgi:hypothetical protein
MDGTRRWMDNVFIERLWRSLKYECVYLLAFETGTEARNEIGACRWVTHSTTSSASASNVGGSVFSRTGRPVWSALAHLRNTCCSLS